MMMMMENGKCPELGQKIENGKNRLWKKRRGKYKTTIALLFVES